MGVKWKVLFHRYAVKDLELLRRAGLSAKAKALAELLENDPFQTPPPYEKLTGDLKGLYSRRINVQHRLVYEVNEETRTVRVPAHVDALRRQLTD